MKRIEAQIMGQGYVLGCPEGGEARLQQAIERVDAAMCKIRDAGRIRARERIAVLAALNLAFDLTEPKSQKSETARTQPSDTAGLSDAAARQATLVQLLGQLDQALREDGQLL